MSADEISPAKQSGDHSADLESHFEEGTAPSASDVVCNLEAELVRRIRVRDSLLLEELIQKSERESDAAGRCHAVADSIEPAQNENNESEQSLRNLHSKLFELSGLEFRARSMATIASRRLLVQDVMLTPGGAESEEPQHRRARELMQERDRRVKALIMQLQVLGDMRDKIDSIRRQRALLNVENRALAGTREAQRSSAEVSDGSPPATNADADADAVAGAPGRPPSDGLEGTEATGLLRRVAAEQRRRVRVRSIFSALVRASPLVLLRRVPHSEKNTFSEHILWVHFLEC